MGYDVDFIRVPHQGGKRLPIEAGAAQALVRGALPIDQPDLVRTTLLRLPGAKLGPDEAIDYLGQGLSYAKLFVRKTAIHVDNNLNSKELLKIYSHLLGTLPDLLILDLQNGRLHDATSYAEWWSRPL